MIAIKQVRQQVGRRRWARSDPKMPRANTFYKLERLRGVTFEVEEPVRVGQQAFSGIG